MYINVNFAIKVNDRNKGSFCEVLGDIYSLDELVKVDVDSTPIINEIDPSKFYTKKEGEKNG